MRASRRVDTAGAEELEVDLVDEAGGVEGLEADTLFRTVLAERIARTGPASGETAQSWADLGQLYITVGSYDSAI